MSETVRQFPQVERLTLDPNAVSRLADRVQARSASNDRVIFGIAGIPGSGKSTLAREVLEEINRRQPGSAALVPMDGFHLTNRRLEELGLRHRKGSPATFDAAGYIDLLRRARASGNDLYFPIYDREIHEPVCRRVPAQCIATSTRFVLAEGNYLLLDEPPWNELKEVLDDAWYVHTPIETAEAWIIARHVRGGRSRADAIAHYQCNDLPNAQIVLQYLRRPDLWLDRPGS